MKPRDPSDTFQGFSGRNNRAASLRQLSFLFNIVVVVDVLIKDGFNGRPVVCTVAEQILDSGGLDTPRGQ